MPHRNSLSSIPEIIEEARQGRMFILIDDENRENEGDLVIPAEKADAHAINFMAKHGRGLICLALTGERVEQLGLPLMSRHNGTRHQTAFTVSIEAREGVTTGISAADRARTVQVAINPDCHAGDITTPGHIFPLVAREGGVLVRAGHTEAAVDIARMAGMNPSGVICEIMNDDGTMARLPDLINFARKHQLKIGTIADLIAWRRKQDKLVERTLETTFTSRYGGEFRLYVYTNTVEYAEHVVLVKGPAIQDHPVWVRMHAMHVLNDVLGDAESGKDGELQRAMQMIGDHGSGVIVLLREPNRAGLSNLIRHRMGEEQEANSPAPLRDYGIGAQILLDLGVHEMLLLTNSDRTPVGLEGYGLIITGRKEIV
ncbi:MAG: 3,4-dihydroxy-2-butanone-4-phosphate synthase [Hyphomicrobiales bacterium]|nr:3,4-dihydroxy-2-butanone-4-phosphate synthase [Hyphomicrobiales bacterium]